MESGVKPKTREGIIQRYFDKCPDARKLIDRQALTKGVLHSQLFRNVIFAAWMAQQEGKEWHVVNLISKTQWFGRERTPQRDYDFNDPTNSIADYLYPDFHDHFTFYTWEELYREIIEGQPNLEDLAIYLRGKTAHLKPAFDILSAALLPKKYL